MNYKDALAIFENESWTDEESAMFYYKWFGEEWLFDMFKEARENNKTQFTKLVKEIKRK